NFDKFSINIFGNSDKGDGYIGDIIFVGVTATNGTASTEEYSLVLKCSKRSQILREISPVKEAFMNEIYFYDVVLPAFTRFQKEKGITDLFDSVPKCYGTLIGDNTEVIVFENLKHIGYSLWDKKKPLTRQHVDMVVKEYAKFHAVSIAMKDQNPEQFEELIAPLGDIFKKFVDSVDVETLYGNVIDEICDSLKDELDGNILLKWRNIKKQINFIMNDIARDVEGLKVVLHSDCWNNNFMFKHSADEESRPLKVAILDWQISKYSSPIFDLSYFLFACISKGDIENLEAILKSYYESLANYLRRLGSDSEALYRFDQFLEDWKKLCRFGILITCMLRPKKMKSSISPKQLKAVKASLKRFHIN
ncbi:EcKinase, DUF1679, and/or APH domain containing protein, partial [Asbolus verrucosus]